VGAVDAEAIFGMLEYFLLGLLRGRVDEYLIILTLILLLYGPHRLEEHLLSTATRVTERVEKPDNFDVTCTTRQMLPKTAQFQQRGEASEEHKHHHYGKQY